MKRIAVLLLVAMVAVAGLSGCTNIKDDQTRTKTEGTAVGAGIGAVVGGLLGQIIGGDTTATLVGAAVGALAGSAAGYAYGSHVANQKKKYANQEDWLNACIASAQKVNNETMAYNQQLRAQLNKLDQETAALAAAYQQKRAKKSRLAAEKKKIDGKLAQAKQRLERAKSELKLQQDVMAEAQKTGKKETLARLNSQIQQLKKQIAELEGHTESLASISARMSV